jgi:hypothetical protein
MLFEIRLSKMGPYRVHSNRWRFSGIHGWGMDGLLQLRETAQILAPSAFRFSCGRNAMTGQESTPEQSECHYRNAIKKIYLTDVAAVIEEFQLQCFKAKPKKPHPQPIQRPSLTV